MKTFVIGDIHGAHLALKEVLSLSNFDREKDCLVAIGDVCDGWPETSSCIQELLSIKNLVFCRGNHDNWARQFLKWNGGYNPDYDKWLHHGGSATLASYVDKPELVEPHLRFLNAIPYYHLDDQNRLFLHAGFRTKLPLDDQPDLSIFIWDRTFWQNVSNGFLEGCESFKHIYIGHTPTIQDWDHGKPVTFGNVTNMDTGAAFYGRLSMQNIDTGELFQSRPVYQHYPDHPGRNGCLLTKIIKVST